MSIFIKCNTCEHKCYQTEHFLLSILFYIKKADFSKIQISKFQSFISIQHVN